MLFSVVVLLDRDVAVAPVFPELVIGGNKVQREGFAHEVELRRIADTRTGLELCRTFGCSGLISPFVGIFDGNLLRLLSGKRTAIPALPLTMRTASQKRQ